MGRPGRSWFENDPARGRVAAGGVFVASIATGVNRANLFLEIDLRQGTRGAYQLLLRALQTFQLESQEVPGVARFWA